MPALTARVSPFAPGALAAEAASSEALARAHEAEAERLRDDLSGLMRTGVRGAWWEAARGRLELIPSSSTRMALRQARVSEILHEAEGLSALLEGLWRRAKRASDHSVILGAIYRWLRSLGDLLDWQCARSITQICTPIAPPPIDTLGSMRDLTLDAIHERVLLLHPELEELAAAHPDARFLEATPDTVVAAFGDIDSADSVTTIVAGVGSSDRAGWHGQFERVRSVAGATSGAAIAWLGYRAPDTVPRALVTAPAAAGARRLRAFQRDLAERRPDQRRTVVGYSYGSIVAGAAARGEGLVADDLVFMASPGVPARTAADLILSPGGRVHAITAPGDPIGILAGGTSGSHGVDPTAEAFGAKVWDVSPGGHSSYWEDPRTLSALRTITNGGRASASPGTT